MKYGLYLPNFGAETSARGLADLAQAAEEAGWDGFFLWDHVIASQTQSPPLINPWIALTAMALATNHIRLGTTVTPVPRRLPWLLARETAAIDQLSDGRLVLGVGIGVDEEYEQFGQEMAPRQRGEKLDESLEIITGLWSGKPFSYKGKHYRVRKTTFLPPAVQSPRIPIWVGGFWPNKRPFLRAARWDGVIPLSAEGGFLMTPDQYRELLAFIRKYRPNESPLEVVNIGNSTAAGADGSKGVKKISQYTAAGVTWWLEILYSKHNSMAKLRQRILEGPPG